MHEYLLIEDLSRIKEIKVDTSIIDSHIYNPVYKIHYRSEPWKHRLPTNPVIFRKDA